MKRQLIGRALEVEGRPSHDDVSGLLPFAGVQHVTVNFDPASGQEPDHSKPKKILSLDPHDRGYYPHFHLAET